MRAAAGREPEDPPRGPGLPRPVRATARGRPSPRNEPAGRARPRRHWARWLREGSLFSSCQCKQCLGTSVYPRQNIDPDSSHSGFKNERNKLVTTPGLMELQELMELMELSWGTCYCAPPPFFFITLLPCNRLRFSKLCMCSSLNPTNLSLLLTKGNLKLRC